MASYWDNGVVIRCEFAVAWMKAFHLVSSLAVAEAFRPVAFLAVVETLVAFQEVVVARQNAPS